MFLLGNAAAFAAGGLDGSFANGGVRVDPPDYCGESRANAVARQADGKVVVAGSAADGSTFHVFVARRLADGSADTSFAEAGIRRITVGLVESSALALVLQADGAIVIAGWYRTTAGQPHRRVFLARVTSAGVLDPSFGSSGVMAVASHGFAEDQSEARAVLLQPDGRIVIAGRLLFGDRGEFFVSRFTTAGAPDATFGSNGHARTVTTDSLDGRGAALQADGAIVVVGDLGSSSGLFPAVARFTSAGALDTTFDGDGLKAPVLGAFGVGRAVAIQGDGRIVIGGRVNGPAAFMRLLANGSIDTSYNGSGVALLEGGGELVDVSIGQDGFHYGLHWNTASSVAVRRASSTGMVEAFSGTAFEMTGPVGQRPAAFAASTGGFWIAGGTSGGHVRIARSFATGAADPSFATGGSMLYGAGLVSPMGAYQSVIVGSSGSITQLRAATCPPEMPLPTSDPRPVCGRLTRLTAAGQVDPAFAPRLVLSAPIQAFGFARGITSQAAATSDGKLLYTAIGTNGSSDIWHLARMNADGSDDTSFPVRKLMGDDFPMTGVNGFVHLYPDGRILFGSTLSFRRYLADGTPDPSFNLGQEVHDKDRTSIALHPDGGYVLGDTAGRVRRRGPDGLIDFGFGTNGNVQLQVGTGGISVDAIAFQPDGKIVVAGRYNTFGASPTPWVGRLLASGAWDTTFGTGGNVAISGHGGTRRLAGVLVRPDGAIVVAGTDQVTTPPYRGWVAQLNASGAFDATFGTGGIAIVDPSAGADVLTALALHTDGGVLLGGAVNGFMNPASSGQLILGTHAVMKVASGPDIQPASLPVGGLSQPYSAQLAASGGSPPYSYSVTGGALPTGLSLSSGGAVTGTPTAAGVFSFTVTATGASGPPIVRTLSLVVHSASTLIESYYQTVLGRASDANGRAFWEGEIARMSANGANVAEVFYSMAANFFGSAEYQALATSDTRFMQDLYRTFFNRDPDPSGAAFWASELAQGKPRGAVLNDFLFSPEFADFITRIFGAAASSRAEISMVLDFYRGLLARLPDAQGLSFWLARFRAAQCNGTVAAEAALISAQFIGSGEYATRQSSLPAGQRTAAYVVDLYNAFLKRGGDRPGFFHWVNQIDSGAMTREQVRQAFVDSPEFQARVQAVIAAGCVS